MPTDGVVAEWLAGRIEAPAARDEGRIKKKKGLAVSRQLCCCFRVFSEVGGVGLRGIGRFSRLAVAGEEDPPVPYSSSRLREQNCWATHKLEIR